jgi:hypothetical protein
VLLTNKGSALEGGTGWRGPGDDRLLRRHQPIRLEDELVLSAVDWNRCAVEGPRERLTIDGHADATYVVTCEVFRLEQDRRYSLVDLFEPLAAVLAYRGMARRRQT